MPIFESYLLSLLKRLICDERGNFAIIAALLMLPLVVGSGGVVDMAFAIDTQNSLQQATDAAALAAATADADVQEQTARNTFESNIRGKLANARMRFAAGADGIISVSGVIDYKPAFLSIIGMGSFPVSATSTAVSSRTEDTIVTVSHTETVTEYQTACMLVKSPSGGNALLVNGPANVDAGDCEIHVRSASNDAFMFNSGTRFNAGKFCIKGTATLRGSTDGTVEQGCGAAGDTLAGTLPEPSSSVCTFNNYTPSGSNAVLVPGVYCGWSNFNSGMTVTLTSGLYVIKDGGWNLNDSTITGTGVTLYLTGSYAGFNMNGSVSMELTAPTGGTYKGILIYQNPSLPQNIISINARRGQYLKGLIYLPTQEIHYKSVSKIGTRDAISVVVNKMIIDGEAVWRFGPSEDYQVPGSATTTERTVTSTETVPGAPGAPRLIR